MVTFIVMSWPLSVPPGGILQPDKDCFCVHSQTYDATKQKAGETYDAAADKASKAKDVTAQKVNPCSTSGQCSAVHLLSKPRNVDMHAAHLLLVLLTYGKELGRLLRIVLLSHVNGLCVAGI